MHAISCVDRILLLVHDLTNIVILAVSFNELVSKPLTFIADDSVIDAAQSRRLLVVDQRGRIGAHLRHPLLHALLLDV